MPRSPNALGAVGLGVSDLARSVDFYTRVLGMTQIRTFKIPYMDEVVVAYEGRTAVVLMHYTDGSARNYTDNPVKLILYVPDPGAVVELIRAEGLSIVREAAPHPMLDGAVMALAKDPDGYSLELVELPARSRADDKSKAAGADDIAIRDSKSDTAHEADWRSGRITDEGIAEMQALVGAQSVALGAWNHIVTADAIWHFALGIGDDNPLWVDPEYAARSPYGEIIALPTYLYSHAYGPRDPRKTGFTAIESCLPGVLGLWAKERWIWHRAVFVGEKISAVTGLDSVIVNPPGKFGGRSVTQTDRCIFTTEAGEVVAESYMTIKRFERGEARANQHYLDRPLAKYTQEDRDRFARQYESEAARRRGDKPRYAEDVAAGDPVGPILKGPLTVANMMGYVMGQGTPMTTTNRIYNEYLNLFPSTLMVHPDTGVAENYESPHWDAPFAKLSGLPAGYDFGAQRFSSFAHLATDWGGDFAMLRELEMKLLMPNLIGDVTSFKGSVAGIEGNVATLSLESTNQLGQTTSVAKATIVLPRKGNLTSHLKVR
jgi:acyl dehydratase/catechol 2,3-dioxygenase-like lactoylglutathione lyase family enzyme